MKFRPSVDCLEDRDLMSSFLGLYSAPPTSPLSSPTIINSPDASLNPDGTNGTGTQMLNPLSPISSPTGPTATDPLSTAPVGDFQNTGGSTLYV